MDRLFSLNKVTSRNNCASLARNCVASDMCKPRSDCKADFFDNSCSICACKVLL